MAAITMELLTGCALSPEEREIRACDALERKYGEEFEIAEVYPLQFPEDYYTVEAYAVKYPDLPFVAKVDFQGKSVADDCVSIRVCDAIKEQAEKNLDRMPGIYQVCTYVAGPQPVTSNAGISIREYAELDLKNTFRFELVFCPDDGALPQDMYAGLEKLLNSMEFLHAEVWLRIVDREQFSRAEEILAEDGVQSLAYKQFGQQVIHVWLPYEKGKLQMTDKEFNASVRNGT